MHATQAGKDDDAQQQLANALPAYDSAAGTADAAVVGCGPAGLALAAELASRGVRVVLIGAGKDGPIEQKLAALPNLVDTACITV